MKTPEETMNSLRSIIKKQAKTTIYLQDTIKAYAKMISSLVEINEDLELEVDRLEDLTKKPAISYIPVPVPTPAFPPKGTYEVTCDTKNDR